MKKLENMTAHELFKAMTRNKELGKFMFGGFIKGAKKGKSMRNVTLSNVMFSLGKQECGAGKAFVHYTLQKERSIENLKQALADVINVAGLAFLKLQEDLK